MKTTIYSIDYYHYSQEEAMEGLVDLLEALAELAPDLEVKYKSCKSDFGILTITKEHT